MRWVLVAFAWNRGGRKRRKEGKGSRRVGEEAVLLRALSRGWHRESERRGGREG